MIDINNLDLLNADMVAPETFKLLCNAVNFLKEEYPDTVTGLWYLVQSGCDGEIRVILRTELRVGTTDYLYLEGRLSKVLGGCIVYDYTHDIIHAEHHEDVVADVLSEIENKEVYTLYVVD